MISTEGSTTTPAETRKATYLPSSTAPREIGRVNRYVMVLSSTSSAISDVPYATLKTGTVNRR